MYSFWYLKTESGDYYDGYYYEVLDENEDVVRRDIVEKLWFEIKYYAEEEGLSKEYCLTNPDEALECALLYPTIRFIK